VAEHRHQLHGKLLAWFIREDYFAVLPWALFRFLFGLVHTIDLGAAAHDERRLRHLLR